MDCKRSLGQSLQEQRSLKAHKKDHCLGCGKKIEGDQVTSAAPLAFLVPESGSWFCHVLPVSWMSICAPLLRASEYYRSEDFPEEARQAWGISDKDFKEIKFQLVGTRLPPARCTQKDLEQKGTGIWGTIKPFLLSGLGRA